jgi:hypothetical protein
MSLRLLLSEGTRGAGSEQPWCPTPTCQRIKEMLSKGAKSLCSHSRRPVSDRRSRYRITAIHFGQFFRCALNVGVTREPSGEYPRGGIPHQKTFDRSSELLHPTRSAKAGVSGTHREGKRERDARAMSDAPINRPPPPSHDWSDSLAHFHGSGHAHSRKPVCVPRHK